MEKGTEWEEREGKGREEEGEGKEEGRGREGEEWGGEGQNCDQERHRHTLKSTHDYLDKTVPCLTVRKCYSDNHILWTYEC